jgi:signal transduction histidine kinase
LGSELLTSLGLNNFILMPVFTQNKSYGLIVIDQSMSKKMIQEDDIELLNLLSMNITIYLKNKELEKEKLSSEKHTTISYLSNKILRELQLPMANIKDIIQEYHTNGNISERKMLGIDSNINKIIKLSSMVLDYSDRDKYSFEKIDLKDVIDKSIDNCKFVLSETLIDLSKLYTHREDVIGNAYKLEKVITNIITNAIEAVDNVGGRINITTKSLPNAVQIKISDNGQGIEEKNLKKIFDPFVSLRDSSGLGLAIAKKIIKEHSGEIRVRSEIGKGTEVRIILNIYKEE